MMLGEGAPTSRPSWVAADRREVACNGQRWLKDCVPGKNFFEIWFWGDLTAPNELFPESC